MREKIDPAFRALTDFIIVMFAVLIGVLGTLAYRGSDSVVVEELDVDSGQRQVIIYLPRFEFIPLVEVDAEV